MTLGLRLSVRSGLYAILAVGIISTFVGRVYAVHGPSMSPTIFDGQYLVVNRLAYQVFSPHRGDIVTLTSPRDSKAVYVKRVVGMPHDLVSVEAGTLFVDGTPLDEPYLSQSLAMEESLPPTRIPEGFYFVLGDNRPISSDSREWGLVSEDSIMGRADLRVWPPTAVGYLH